MLSLMGIAAVLVVLFGAVSGAQRMSEGNRQIERLLERRRTLADSLAKLQEQSRFLEVYTQGDSGRLAQTVLEQVRTLNAQFAKASDMLEALRHKRAVRSLDASIAAAEVGEMFDNIARQLASTQTEMQRFKERTGEAKHSVAAIEQRWNSIRRTLTELVPETDAPSDWVQEWRDVERELTLLKADPDEVARARRTTKMEDVLRVWEARVPRLQVWHEWRHKGRERTAVLFSCMERLEQLQAKDTQTYQDVARAVEDANRLMSMAPKDAVESAAAARLGEQFTGLVARASILLTALRDKAGLAQTLKTQWERLGDEVAWWESEEAVAADRRVQAGEPAWHAAFVRRRDAALSDARLRLAPASDPPSTPRDALLALDQALAATEALRLLRADLTHHWAHWREDDATLAARLNAVQRRLGEALEKLAAANLAESEEYKKLSAWQTEVAACLADPHVDAARVDALEERVRLEMRVVEAAVAARTDVDTSLREHAEALARRHQGSWPQYGPTQGVGPLDAVDLTGAAFASLAVLDAVLAAEAWDDWNDADAWNSWDTWDPW